VIKVFSRPADVKSPHDAFNNLHIHRAVEESRSNDSLNGIGDWTGKDLVPLCSIGVNALGESCGEALLDEIGVRGPGLENLAHATYDGGVMLDPGIYRYFPREGMRALILTRGSLTTNALSDENLADKLITKKSKRSIACERASELNQVVELIPEDALGVQNFGILGRIRHSGGQQKVGESE
jgi:hypothetical protein